jgi:aromatic ring-cleaving dioxygenase
VITTEIRQGRYRESNVMTKTKRPTNAHKAYYAHVYFDEDTKTVAKKSCDVSAKDYGVQAEQK